MSRNQDQYYQNVVSVLEHVHCSQSEAILQAASIFAQCVKKEGIIHSFGSGHSFAAAIELACRAGGLVNTRAIDNFYGVTGWFDSLPGIGDTFSNLLDIRSQDCLVMISSSGTKPLHTELARNIKDKGIKLIIITSMAGKSIDRDKTDITSFADVIIDNGCPVGDCSLSMDNGQIMTGPVSSISVAWLINAIVIRCIELLLAEGYEPPVMRSINLPGGKEYNDALYGKYRERVFTV